MAYRDIITADSPLYYWPMDEASGTSLAALVGLTAITISGATVAQAGQVDGTAVAFDGANDSGSVAIDLSAYSDLTVEFLLYIDPLATIGNDDLAMEFTANSGTNNGGFMVNLKSSANPTNKFFCSHRNSQPNSSHTDPLTNGWHHIAVRYNFSAAAASEVTIYIDGVEGFATKQYSNNTSGSFANSTLYLMCRAGTSLFAPGKMQHLAIYTSLSEANITAHATASGVAVPRITLDGGSFYGNAYDGSGTPKWSPLSSLDFTTTASKLRVKANCTVYGSLPAFSHVGYVLDGVAQSPLAALLTGANVWLPVPGSAGVAKTISLVNGLQSNPSGTILGTWITQIDYEHGYTATVTSPTTDKRVVVYGDSIGVGANATNPETEGWAAVLRRTHNRNVLVEGHGFRALADDTATAGTLDTTKSQALADFIAGCSPSLLVITIGTNDYGLNKWSAANYGTALADFLDRFHTALPDVKVLLVSPIQRISPASESANGSGSTLGDYRTQEATIAGTRAWIDYHTGAAAAIVTNGQMDSDGIHPTTAGHAAMAAAIEGWIEPLMLTAPTIGTATANSTSQITVTWTDNSENEDGFEVQYCESIGFETEALPQTVTADAEAETLAVTDLGAEKTYYFRVRATGTSGDSDWSAIVSATTDAAPAPGVTTSVSESSNSSSGSGNRRRLLAAANRADTMLATGSTQSDATRIRKNGAVIINADGTKGIVLPAIDPGDTVFVANPTNAILKVYPPSGQYINAGNLNAAFSQTGLKNAIYRFCGQNASGENRWHAILSA